MRGGTVSVFSNGNIVINTGNDEIESFHVSDIVSANNNINNHDPSYSTAVKIITKNKAVPVHRAEKLVLILYIKSLIIIIWSCSKTE